MVLIADDSIDAQELYGVYLTRSGFTVHAAGDGRAAVDLAVRIKPDVIVMDLSMPDVDGLTAIRRLKLQPRTWAIPIILLTGYAAKAIEQGAIEAGAAIFLTKPCLPEDLEGHVRRLIDRPRRK